MNMSLLYSIGAEEFTPVRIGSHVFNFVALGQAADGLANAYKVSVESDTDAAPSYPELFNAAETAIGIEPASIDGDTVYIQNNPDQRIPYFKENPYQSTPVPEDEVLVLAHGRG